MKQEPLRKSKRFIAIACLSMVLLLCLPTVSYAAPTVSEQLRARERIRWRIRTLQWHGLDFVIGTDLFTVKFAGSVEVPKFQYWYSGEDETVYQVFFHQVFEFNDINGDGTYKGTEDERIVGQTFALSGTNLSLSEPTYIKDEDERTVGVSFNFTINGKRGQGRLEDVAITLQCSLYEEDYQLVSEGITYNVTGGAELKIDVIIDKWPWASDESLLGLWWSVNRQDGSGTPETTENAVSTVNFGKGYLSWLSTAMVDDEPVDVTSSFNMTGRTVNIFMVYPNFGDGRLVHDPSLGVNVSRPDVVPKGFVEEITANRTHTFLFKNFALMLHSQRSLQVNITVDSKVTTRYFSLTVDPSESVHLEINANVTPPSGVIALERTLNLYVDIDPNVTVPLNARLRLHIDEAALEGELHRVINASRLTWAYWNRTRTGWVPVESYMDADGYLVCNTTHFSTWTVVEITPLDVTGSLSKAEVTAGETVTVSATVKDEDGNPLEGANVQTAFGGTTISLSDQGSGNYEGNIDTSDLTEGTYDIVVTADKDGYVSDQDSLILSVKQPTQWMNYALIGLAIAAVAIVVVIALVRRK